MATKFHSPPNNEGLLDEIARLKEEQKALKGVILSRDIELQRLTALLEQTVRERDDALKNFDHLRNSM